VAIDASDRAFEPPAIVVIGEIVAAREKILGMAATADGEVSR
jgi:siroheme synthase